MEKLSWLPDENIELKDIEGYEGLYGITSDGRVWSYPREWISGNNILRRHNGKWLKNGRSEHAIKRDPIKRKPVVSFHKNGISKTFDVHRLVADTFLNNKHNYRYIHHIDGNYFNNNVTNLELVYFFSEKYKKVSQYTKDNIYIKTYNSLKSAAMENGLYGSSICNCAKGKIKSAGGCIWRYAD